MNLLHVVNAGKYGVSSHPSKRYGEHAQKSGGMTCRARKVITVTVTIFIFWVSKRRKVESLGRSALRKKWTKSESPLSTSE